MVSIIYISNECQNKCIAIELKNISESTKIIILLGFSHSKTHWMSDHFGAYIEDIFNRKKVEPYTRCHHFWTTLSLGYKVKDVENLHASVLPSSNHNSGVFKNF